jgi:hypothetical protein
VTTTVLRYRCDICGGLYLLDGQALLCEAKCADIAAQVDRSPKGQDPAEGLGRNDESAVPQGCAQKDQSA